MKLFGAGGPDHALADRKEARRVLDGLPSRDLKALEELALWHESVGATPGFKPEDRAERLAMIDETAQPRLRKLERDYLAAARAARASQAQQDLVWSRVHEYWRQAAQAHARCVDAVAQGGKGAEKTLAPAILAALRATAQQLKWQQLRYGPIDPATWGLLNRLFAAAEARGIAEANLEFLKAAMFSASSPDSLLPLELELAERLIAELAPGFALSRSPGPDLPYWIDLGQAMAPARVAKPPPPAAGLRCLGPGASAATLRGWIERVAAKGQPPSGLKLGAEHDAETVLGVMQHLALYWAPAPPARQHKRHSMMSSLSIVHGFDGVLEVLGGGGGSLDFGAGGAGESWSVENASAGGFGALIAAKPDNTGSWMVGTVRRVSKISNQQIRVGVETLSRAPAVSQFALRNATQAPGVLLPAAVPGAAEAAIALRAGVYLPGENLEARIGERQHVYMPQGVAERGDDYEIVKIREMVREA
jgi:hypothetical protein